MDNNKYMGLKSVLQSDRKAAKFFDTLPDFIQGGIMLHSESIKSTEDLHRCADRIMHEFE